MSSEPGPKRSVAPPPPSAAAAAEPRVLVSDRQSTPVDVPALTELAARVLSGEGRGEVELSLSFVTPDEMRELHERYMGDAGPTDVLSFPMDEDDLLGDVVICPSVAVSNASAAGGSADPEAELRLLVVHGILHLLGHDHEEPGERAGMWAIQERYSGVHVE